MENAPRSTQRRNRSTSTTRALAWLMTVALVAAVVLLVSSTTAAQEIAPQSVTVTIDVKTIVRGDPGYTEVVRTLTPAELDAEVGWVCALVGFGDNGESTHPGTNAFVSSNGDQVTIPDWERAANTRTPATMGTLTLGTAVTIAIQVGEDGVASGGLEIQFTCNPPTTTTTSTSVAPPTSSTTTEPPTVGSTLPPATTTTEPAPIGGPETGGGACSDGACAIGAFSLSPATTWLLLGGALAGVAALGLLVIIGGQRKQDPPYE